MYNMKPYSIDPFSFKKQINMKQNKLYMNFQQNQALYIDQSPE